MDKNITNNNIKSYVEALVKQPRTSQHKKIGVAFDRRKIDGQRTIVVMACGREGGTQGMVEAKAITSMLMEWVLSGVPFLVMAQWIVRGFGCGVQYAVIDVDDITGDAVLMDCSVGSQKIGLDIEELSDGGESCNDDMPLCREFMVKICSDNESGSVFTTSCLNINNNDIHIETSKHKQSMLSITKHNLSIGDSIIFGSWLSDSNLNCQMAACYDILGKNIRSSAYEVDSIKPSALNYLKDCVKSLCNDEQMMDMEMTIGLVCRRVPRRLLFCSGPPFNEKNDERLCETVDQWKGTKLISGGTTAQIISRGLGRDISVEFKRDVSGLPPVSFMDGVDLITEGVLTLSKLNSLLERASTLDLHGEGIDYRVAMMLLSHDEIQFLVGTRINIVHQDPNLPMEIELRRNVIKKIAKLLESKFLKRVKIIYL